MNYVDLTNKLQIRIIELIYDMDANLDGKRFSEIMLKDLGNGMHIANRIKINLIKEELYDYIKDKSNLTNSELDTILREYNIIKDKYFK